MTSANTVGSTPNLRVSEKASPMASLAQPSTMLFASFTAAAPAVLVPPLNVRRPIAPKTGSSFSIAAAGPAATMTIWPAAAASGRPSTGALTNAMPALSCTPCSSFSTSTPCVPMATWTAPLGSLSSKPPWVTA